MTRTEAIKHSIWFIVFCICPVWQTGLSHVHADDVDFNRDIRPILSNKCYLCHGPDESSRKADLRLDSFEAATEYVIDPGDAENSEFYLRISDDDDSARMPPAEHGPALTEQEVGMLKRWIDSGAKFQKHWAYVAPTRTAIQPNNGGWEKNEIDVFVLRQMKLLGLRPSKPADRYSIIRRLSLDLTGLPPSIDEAESLFQNQTDEQYEAMVDYFLSRPSFGERWAAVWLDYARYADSMGYAEDRHREIWTYRDYVIRSFNQNKPFDQFTIEQLAGDLLENPTEEQMVATAFHRNTLTNTEGGTIDEEFRSAAVVDRTNTTMAVWMGTTMACAQCHTHKYDPITQNEYFQFYAFFNNTEDNDQPDESPVLNIYTDEQKQTIADLTAKIDKLKIENEQWLKLTDEARQEYYRKNQRLWEKQLPSISTNDIQGKFVRVEHPIQGEYLSLAEVEVFVDGENVARSGKASQSSTSYDGPARLAIDGNTDGNHNLNKSVSHTNNEGERWWELELAKTVTIEKLVVWNRTEGLHERLNGAIVSILDENRTPIWKKTIAIAKAGPETFAPKKLPDEVFVAITANPQSVKQRVVIADFFEAKTNPIAENNRRIQTIQRQIEQVDPYTSVPVMKEQAQQRSTFVHIRGSYQDLGEKVERGTPAVFCPLPQR